MPKISVIVPVYNVEKYIRQCLDSIEGQTFRDFEVLCVDDCGNDNSISIVEEFVAKDDRFKILRHEKNKGVSAARNTALDNATGDYIFCIDSDDWVEPNLFEIVCQKFDEIPLEVGAIWFNSYKAYPDGSKKLLTQPSQNYDPLQVLGIDNNNILQFVGCIWDKAFKRDAIEFYHIRFPEGYIVEDDEFSFKFFSMNNFVYRIEEPLYNYRFTREGSLTTEDIDGNRIHDSFIIYKNMYDWAVKMNIFAKYKGALLDKLGQTIYCISSLPKQHQDIVKIADEILDYIKFPNDFRNLDTEAEKKMIWFNK